MLHFPDSARSCARGPDPRAQYFPSTDGHPGDSPAERPPRACAIPPTRAKPQRQPSPRAVGRPALLPELALAAHAPHGLSPGPKGPCALQKKHQHRTPAPCHLAWVTPVPGARFREGGWENGKAQTNLSQKSTVFGVGFVFLLVWRFCLLGPLRCPLCLNSLMELRHNGNLNGPSGPRGPHANKPKKPPNTAQ